MCREERVGFINDYRRLKNAHQMKRVVAASDKMKDIYAFQLIGFFAYPCLSVLDLTFKPQDGHVFSLIEKSAKHSGHLLTFMGLYFTMAVVKRFSVHGLPAVGDRGSGLEDPSLVVKRFLSSFCSRSIKPLIVIFGLSKLGYKIAQSDNSSQG